MEQQLFLSWEKLTEKLIHWLEVFIYNIPNILLALLVFAFSYWFARKVQKWSNRGLQKVIKETAIRGLLSNIFSIIVILLGLVLGLSVLNLEGAVKSVLAGAGVAGLAVGLALQGTLSNIFSGVTLAIKRELNIGDWVETNGYAGEVVEIDLRNTKVKESDNNIVVIPNKMILENPYKNFGLTRRIRTTIRCGVGYESNLEFVQKIAIQAIEELFPPESGEKVEFYYTEFADSSINFMIRFWVNAKKNMTALEVKSAAIVALKSTFDVHKINIPFPIRTLIQQNSGNDIKP